MFLKICDLPVRVWFGVVDNLAVDVLLGTSFIDLCIQGLFPGEQKVVPLHFHLVSMLSYFPTASLLFSDVSISNLQYDHAAKSINRGNDKDEEELHLCRVSHQIVISPFTQAAVGVRIYGQSLLLGATHPNIVEWKYLIATRGVLELFPGELFVIYIANLSAEAFSLPKNIIVTCTTSTLPHITHAISNELDTQDELKLDNTTNANEE